MVAYAIKLCNKLPHKNNTRRPFNSQLLTKLSKICVCTLIIFSALYNCHLLKIKISLICPSRFVFIVFKYIDCYISLNRFFCLVLLFTKYFRYIIVFIPVWLCRLQFAIKMPYACVIPPFAITIAMRLSFNVYHTCGFIESRFHHNRSWKSKTTFLDRYLKQVGGMLATMDLPYSDNVKDISFKEEIEIRIIRIRKGLKNWVV